MNQNSHLRVTSHFWVWSVNSMWLMKEIDICNWICRSIHVHVQSRSRRMQKSSFEHRKLYRRESFTIEFTGVSGCCWHRKHGYVSMFASWPIVLQRVHSNWKYFRFIQSKNWRVWPNGKMEIRDILSVWCHIIMPFPMKNVFDVSFMNEFYPAVNYSKHFLVFRQTDNLLMRCALSNCR